MADTTKLVYLARRKPGFTREQFVRRWRQHGALAMRQPQLWSRHVRYVQCDTLPPHPAIAGCSGEYDGIAMLWIRRDRLNQRDPKENAIMAADELETFDEPIAHCKMLVDEHIVKPGSGVVKLTSFSTRKPGLTREQFARHFMGKHRDLFTATPGFAHNVRGYVQNIVTDDPYAAQSRYRFDGVAEIYYDSMESALKSYLEPAPNREELIADSQSIMDLSRTVRILSNEVNLYDLSILPAA